MTTIVYDGFELAADSLQTAGNSFKFGYVGKIHTLANGDIVSFAGSSAYGTEILEWIEKGQPVDGKPKKSSNDEFEGIWIVKANGSAYEIDEDLRVFPAVIPWVGGSGSKFAMACLKMGASPLQAVTIACELDPHSGGPIEVVKIK